MASSSAISIGSLSSSSCSNNAGLRPPPKSLAEESSAQLLPKSAGVQLDLGPGPPVMPRRTKWDKEQFDVRRPYERKNYERPHRELPQQLAAFEGLDVKPQKCSVPNAFARRTAIEEVFHARNITTVCRAEAPRPLEDCVGDVIVADNVSSSGGESVQEEEEARETVDDDDERMVSKGCYKSFFRARRVLLRSELFDRYFNRAESLTTTGSGSESVSEEAPAEFQMLSEEPRREEEPPDLDGSAEQLEDGASSQSSYRPPEIVHKESKPALVEAQEQFLHRMRTHYLQRFERVRQEMEREEQERRKQPEPFDGEKYMAQYPAPDIRNEVKVRFRESLEMRLRELNALQERPVRAYPKTVKQFAEYKEQLMEGRRKLRDEAALVEDYFRKTDTPRELSEAKLEVKRFRLADFAVAPDDSDSEAEQERITADPPVYHTCMTREEWSHWMARSTKMEKLKLPKVAVPRVPVLVQRCHESPIRAYIAGRLDEPMGHAVAARAENENRKKHGQLLPNKIIPSLRSTCPRPTMRDLLFDPMPVPEAVGFVPYNAVLRPYSDIVEERFRVGEGQRKGQRQLRKSRMRWIEELVDEICHRKRA